MAAGFMEAVGERLLARIPLAPVVASRPRVTRWGTYYGKKYTAWMKAAKDSLEIVGPGPVEGPVAVFVEQVCARPNTTRRDYPTGDVDNYVKAPLDILTKNGNVWLDDDQVVLLIASKRFAEPDETPATHVIVSPI